MLTPLVAARSPWLDPMKTERSVFVKAAESLVARAGQAGRAEAEELAAGAMRVARRETVFMVAAMMGIGMPRGECAGRVEISELLTGVSHQSTKSGCYPQAVRSTWHLRLALFHIQSM